MPRHQLVCFECEYCGNKETLDLSGDPRKIEQKIKTWHGVVKALDPNPGPNVPDPTRWYCSPNCCAKGVVKLQETEQMTDLVGAAIK
jgi:hypothetical protein